MVILLTDGVNNSGQIAPLTAADIAQTLGIRVYTIGVGSEGTAPYPALDMWGNISYVPMKVEIDEAAWRWKTSPVITNGSPFSRWPRSRCWFAKC